MGIGPFNFNRPLTAGDDGILGVNRPLVGAANGVTYTVNLDSATDVFLNETVPAPIRDAREQLEAVQQDLRNKQQRLAKLEDSVIDNLRSLRDPLTGEERVVDIRDGLRREEEDLSDERDFLLRRLNKMEASPENSINMREVADELEDVLDRELSSIGISKGPFARYTGSNIEVTMTIVGIDSSDVESAQQEIEATGLQVIDREFFEL